MELNRAPARAGLLFLIALSACESADTGGPSARRSVTIDLRALQAPPAGSLQTDCVSAIAEAVLRAGPAGSARELRVSVPAGASSVSFNDIEVEQGMVPFSVSVTSDNGTELYGKDTTTQIDDSTFSIALTVDKRGPVLQVCPGHITLDREGSFQEALEVINRGIDTLTYEAESPDCPGGPCISFDRPVGTVDVRLPGRIVDSLIRMAPAASVEMRVRSPVGSVPIVVRLGQLPDIVVAAFAATDTISFNQELNRFELPVSITLRNDGNVAADTFFVGALSTFADTVGVAAQLTSPSTKAPIAPGESETIADTVSWDTGFQGDSLRLHLWADACTSDGPSPCRIDEFSETNNFSQDILVSLPFIGVILGD
jgi:hypothetical protein